jgi:hypothetical protein
MMRRREIAEVLLTLHLQEAQGEVQNPVNSFMHALKSSEARRQYPKRLKLI